MGWSGRLMLAAGSMLDQPATTVIDAAAAAGFDGVGLRLSGEHASSMVPELRARALDAGVTIFDAEVCRLSAGAADPRPLLDTAAEVGAEAVLVVSDHPNREATTTGLRSLAAACASRGLRLGLEYMAWTDPGHPLAAVELATEVGCEIVVDVLHHRRVGAGPVELDAVVASGRLGWVQLCDAATPEPVRPDAAEHPALVDEARHRRLPPGSGQLPLAPIVSRLPDDVTVSVEVQSDALASIPPIARARLLHDAAQSVLGPQSPSNTG